MDTPIHIPSFPEGLTWQVAPVAWQSTASTGLQITSGPRTDMFISPQGDTPVLNAPRLCAPVSGDWMLHARVTVAFAATFDAGALLLWENAQTWAKLCFEYSPQGQPMVVSVVTRGESDDANNVTIAGNVIWLRIARIGQTVAFHASDDGRVWNLVRHFQLVTGPQPLVGFVSQSPTGAGCSASFDQIQLRAERLADIRSGA